MAKYNVIRKVLTDDDSWCDDSAKQSVDLRDVEAYVKEGLFDVCFFNGISTGTVVSSTNKVPLSAYAEDCKVIYNEDRKCFIFGVPPGDDPDVLNYYNDWKGSARYGTPTPQGVQPVAGRNYVDLSTSDVYRWQNGALHIIGYSLYNYINNTSQALSVLSGKVGKANGIAPLDASALVPEKHLPDKVFDVLTFIGIDDSLYDLEAGSAAATPEDANASLVYSSVRDRFVLRVRETVSGGGISTNPPKYYGWFNGAERYGSADHDGIVPYENKLYLDLYDGGVYYWYDLILRKTDLDVSIRVDSLENKIGKANGIAPLNASGVVPNENISDEARKSLFCDLFNAAAGTAGYAKYTNGVWDCKLNGLTLSYDEAVLIYNVTISGFTTAAFRETAIRTNLYKIGQSYGWGSAADMPQVVFTNCRLLEVARINKSDDGVTWASSWRYMFNGCYALHTVIGVLGGTDSNREILIGNAPKLVKLRINRLARNLDIRYSPLWSLESVSYTIENAGNGTTEITITVHADVYAKLTGDTTNEAAAALTADELSQWQALLTKAAGKHIAFASA